MRLLDVHQSFPVNKENYGTRLATRCELSATLLKDSEILWSQQWSEVEHDEAAENSASLTDSSVIMGERNDLRRCWSASYGQ